MSQVIGERILVATAGLKARIFAESKAGHETWEFESCLKNSSLGYQNGLLDTRK